jgi:selenocysteine-specific elongation factor
MNGLRAVIGVIGHVDHGKTALVRALTGMETDRLEEERRRGISIALGFAHLQVGHALIDLIDMPGHERFVRTMVSGATGITAALLVVAANEGIKPQTVEHLDIAGLLGLRRVIVAISKTDLVTSAQAEAASAAASKLAQTAGLQVCAQILTSVHTGQGLDALRQALAAIADDRPADDDGFPYLPVDRVFSIAGHGTVVTGTLRRGKLALSDEVASVPDGRAIRLRGMQVHGAATSQGLPGQRLAVNLRDVAHDGIARGAALTARGLLPPSIWLTIALRSVDSAPPLPTSTRWALLFGTDEIEARLRLLDCDELPPGGTALAQLKCDAPVSLPARERFILRRISPPLTVAGGRVIDPAATRLRRHAPRILARLIAIADADPAGIVAAEIAAAGAAGIPLTRLAQLAGVAEAQAAALLQALPAILGRSRVALARPEWDRVLAAIPGALAGQQGETPPSRLAALLPWAGSAVLDDAVAELVQKGTLVRAGGGVRLPAPDRDRARAGEEAAAAARMADMLRRAGLSPPDIWVVAPDPKARRLADRLVREGVVVRAVDKVQKRELLFHQDAIELAKGRLRPLLAGAGLATGEASKALGISRKFAVPLLEHLDAIRFTRRIADRRVLAGAEER